MKKRLFTLMVVFLAIHSAGGQNYQDVLKQQKEKMKQQEDVFKKFRKQTEEKLQQIEKDYQSFVAQRDREFSEFLKRTWAEFDVLAGRNPSGKPKPPQAPVAPKLTDDELLKIPAAQPQAVPDLVPVIRFRKEPKTEFELKEIFTEFYGYELKLPVDKRLCQPFTSPAEEEAISRWWLSLSETAYDTLLDLLFGYKEQIGLNDWGYYMLLSRVATSCTENENTAQLLTWFLLNKSGYRCNIGFDGGDISLLLPAMQEIYYLPYIQKDGMRYYAVRELKNIKTYEGHLQGADRLMDLRFESALNFPGKFIAQRSVTFRDQTLVFSYNAKIKDFFHDYPATVLDVYFNTPLSSVAKESLTAQLLPLTDSLPVKEKVSVLLSFLHESFPYQTDDEQFGREKYFFAEEMLAYPYSDCEDRAVFFSWLVKMLTGLPEVGLDYKGHVSTAVQLPEQTEGDYLDYHGARYWACDPTYLGAGVGMSMPEYSGTEAGIIPLSAGLLPRQRVDDILALVKEAGGLLLNSYDHIVADEHNNVYLTGVYEQDFQLGGKTLPAPQGRNIFLAKLDKANQPVWTLPIGGQGTDMPRELKLSGETLLLSGEFEGRAGIGPDTLTAATGSRDLFLASVQPDGKLAWAVSAGLDRDSIHENQVYHLKFTPQGECLSREIVPEQPGLPNQGLTITPRREVWLTGSFNAWNGLKIARAENKNTLGQADISEQLKEATDRQIQNNAEKGVAGLLALMELVSKNDLPVSGEIAARTLDKYNPDFKQRCPNIYKNIRKVTFIRNSKGIILLKTEGGKAVNFDKVQVKDGSKMRIADLPGNNKRVEIIEGIVVGKAFIWFKLNQVTLYAAEGDMLFDYDSDHTLRTFNMTRDILK